MGVKDRRKGDLKIPGVPGATYPVSVSGVNCQSGQFDEITDRGNREFLISTVSENGSRGKKLKDRVGQRRGVLSRDGQLLPTLSNEIPIIHDETQIESPVETTELGEEEEREKKKEKNGRKKGDWIRGPGTERGWQEGGTRRRKLESFRDGG